MTPPDPTPKDTSNLFESSADPLKINTATWKGSDQQFANLCANIGARVNHLLRSAEESGLVELQFHLRWINLPHKVDNPDATDGFIRITAVGKDPAS